MSKPKQAHHHSLTLSNEIHRDAFMPSCACGWKGVVASKTGAEAEYHVHRDQATAPSHEDRGILPRPLTPPHELPEQLRSDRDKFEIAIDDTVMLILTHDQEEESCRYDAHR